MNRNDCELLIRFSEYTAHISATHLPTRITVTVDANPIVTANAVEGAFEELRKEIKRGEK